MLDLKVLSIIVIDRFIIGDTSLCFGDIDIIEVKIVASIFFD